jgi:hypothetical protein
LLSDKIWFVWHEAHVVRLKNEASDRILYIIPH